MPKPDASHRGVYKNRFSRCQRVFKSHRGGENCCTTAGHVCNPLHGLVAGLAGSRRRAIGGV